VADVICGGGRLMLDQLELLLLLGIHLVVTVLPGMAATLFAARCGVRRVPVLLAIGLATTGALAMLCFWAYFANHTFGQSFSWLVLLGSALLAGVCLWERKLDPALLRALATPLLLWIFGSIFLVFLGFVHGGTNAPVSLAALRFSATVLPSDNDIPRFFTEWIYSHGHSGTPPVYPGEWLLSDRPPLQVGYMLLQRPFFWKGNGLDYQIVGVLLQQLWIVGLWALLLAARIGRVTRALVLGAVLVSDVAIINGFFVWPKMLPAAMLIAAMALVVTPLWSEVRRSFWGAALIASLLGIAMLGHGSSLFGAIPVALIAIYRGLPSWRWIAVAVGVGILFLAPWSAYQKYGDPPGNRLNKWMLAGVEEIDNRGTLETIEDSYREAGLGGIVHNKAENFVTMVGGAPFVQSVRGAIDAAGEGDLALAVRNLRNSLFYYLVPSLGFLLLALVLMALFWRRGRAQHPLEWGFALTCLLVVAVGAVIWGLILFGNVPSRAVMHVGSFALPLLLYCAAVCGLRAIFPRFAVYWVIFSSLIMLAVYAPMLEGPPGSSYSPLGILLALAGLVGFGVCTLRSSEPPAEPEMQPREEPRSELASV
jgi:hypothetical protein